jgi:hypothetical protein
VTTTTTRLGLQVPTATDPNNVPADMLRLANALDAVAVVFAEGTLAARPAAAIHGRLYLATDTQAVYYDTGAAWVQLNLNIASTFTAKGDLLVASGAGAATRLGVGSNGQVLQAQSGATNGLQWASVLGLPLALTGAASATRYVGATTSGAPTTGTFAVGDYVIAQNGHVWICTGAGTPGTWIDAGAWTLGLPLGLTGATAATRYVGGTTSGAPTTGTFAKGDFVIDQTGNVWICTVAGTPGTWVSPGQRRYVGRGLRSSGNKGSIAASVHSKFFEFSFPAVAGRIYQVGSLFGAWGDAASQSIANYYLTYTTDGTAPDRDNGGNVLGTSISLSHQPGYLPPSGTPIGIPLSGWLTVASSVTVRCLISMIGAGSSTFGMVGSSDEPAQIWAEDWGIDPGLTGNINY